jgi:Protein of unknown function (DUF3306)
MSADEKGFLARWSERKREAAKSEAKSETRNETEREPKPVPSDAQAPQAPPAEATAGETEQPFDLTSLPKLEELTADTDMTVFFKKGVPESIRNAALRKSWALDPAIRDYVSPALDYAYDWNTPGGVPGSGELAPGTNVAQLVAQVMGWTEPPQPPEAGTPQAEQPSGPIADGLRQPDAPPQSVRLSAATPPEQAAADIPATGESVAQDEETSTSRDSASQPIARRHGSARPQ